MKEPVWITLETLNIVHDMQLAEHGGASGVRDTGLLESALNRPKQAFYYGQGDLIDLAALYAHALCKNHPYIDGNKRTAFVACALFLERNGYVFNAPESQATVAMLDLAAGDLDETGFAAWLRDNTSGR